MPKEHNQSDRIKYSKSDSNSNSSKSSGSTNVLSEAGAEIDPNAAMAVSSAMALDGGGITDHRSELRPSINTPPLLPRSNTSLQHLHQPSSNSGGHNFFPGVARGVSTMPVAHHTMSLLPWTSLIVAWAEWGRKIINISAFSSGIADLNRAIAASAPPPNPTQRTGTSGNCKDVFSARGGWKWAKMTIFISFVVVVPQI